MFSGPFGALENTRRGDEGTGPRREGRGPTFILALKSRFCCPTGRSGTKSTLPKKISPSLLCSMDFRDWGRQKWP